MFCNTEVFYGLTRPAHVTNRPEPITGKDGVPRYRNTNTCVCCDAEIPEGLLNCPKYLDLLRLSENEK